jgi:nucleoside-diphosphate-sugar epimerase
VIGEAFIIASDKPVTLNDLTARIAKQYNTTIPRFKLPVWPVWIAGAVFEVVCKPLGINPPLYRRRVCFFTQHRAFDYSKAKRILGYESKISLDDGIKEVCENA